MTNISFPNKEQAIIIEAVSDTTVKEYIQAVAKITGPNAIRFVSRISNERICIYFNSKTTAKRFVTNYKSLSINNIITTVRPLLDPSQRIVLSNVSPTIPHSFIEKFLTDHNIKLTSKLTFLRAEIQENGFSYIMSFRRQIYINPDDVTKISESFLITHEDTQYRIFVSIDKVSCFLRKQEGHIAKQCNNPTKPIPTNSNQSPKTPKQSTHTINTQETTSRPTGNLTGNREINEIATINAIVTLMDYSYTNDNIFCE